MCSRVATTVRGRSGVLAGQASSHPTQPPSWSTSTTACPACRTPSDEEKSAVEWLPSSSRLSTTGTTQLHTRVEQNLMCARYSHEQEMASPGWVAGVRQLCDTTGALLILDDVRAGFRLSLSNSWSALYSVTPDLVCFSKATRFYIKLMRNLRKSSTLFNGKSSLARLLPTGTRCQRW